MTYLGHPHYLPYIPGRSPIMSTHHVDEDDSRRNLEMSTARKQESRLTESYSHVEAKAGASSASDTSNMKSRCWGSIPDRYQTSRMLQSSRIQDRTYHRQHSAVPEPQLTIYGNCSTMLNARPWTLNFIRSNIHFRALFIGT